MNKQVACLAQSIEALGMMNDALQHLRKDLLPTNPKMFAILAEGPLEEISRLKVQIEEQTQALVAA